MSQHYYLRQVHAPYGAGAPAFPPVHSLPHYLLSFLLSLFGRPFVKLCYGTVVCHACHVCNVGMLWPNGWMDQEDQDETWDGGRPRPWPHCVRWKPSSPPPKVHSPQFSAHVCCDQRLDGSRCQLVRTYVGLGPRPHCVKWGPNPSSAITAAWRSGNILDVSTTLLYVGPG